MILQAMQTFIEWAFRGFLFVVALILSLFALPVLLPIGLVVIVIIFVLLVVIIAFAIAIIEGLSKFVIPAGVIYLLYLFAQSKGWL